jgi:hypothetical protein
MPLLASLLLVAQEGPYDPDPAHLWNRLHRALMTWQLPTDERPVFEPDLLHWPAHPRSLHLAHQLSAAPVLEEFLKADLAKDPLRRALLQRDLWTVFDLFTELRGGSQFFDAVKRDFVPLEGGAVRRLLELLARAMRRVALDAAEIGALPDNLARAVADTKLPRDFDPRRIDRAFLPADLFAPDGPWVLVGDRSEAPLAAQHVEFFRGRSVFLVLLRLPGDRKATEEFLDKLRAPGGRELTMPDGAQSALVRRALLVDREGSLVPTRLVESVQFRVDWKAVPVEPGQDFSVAEVFQKFRLRRADLLAGRAGGLSPVGPGTLEHSQLSLLGRAKENEKSLVLGSCRACHVGGGLGSLTSFSRFPIAKPGSTTLVPVSEKDEEERLVRWKLARPDTELLRKLYSAD